MKIDNVVVRSMPRCEQPSNINVSNLTQTSCTLNWYAGFEAVNIAVKINTKPLSIEELENKENNKDLFLDTLLPGTDIQLPLNNLSTAENYYVYIKGICVQEESDWSDAFMFSTSNVKTLPYYEDFNLPYQSGYNVQMDGWYYGTSTDGLSPFINTSTSADQLCRYSEDCSTSLCFCNNGYTTSAIPAGEWSYAATPQIQVEKIQDVQVSFDAVTTTTLDEKMLEKALESVKRNIDNTEYSVSTLCGDVGMSKTQLNRKLQSITGLTPLQFIRSVRLKKAAQLLLSTDCSISEAADLAGFNSIKYFNIHFKEEFGMTPTRFRETQKG